jgi:predicted ABC-type sugar transport system permease subunit
MGVSRREPMLTKNWAMKIAHGVIDVCFYWQLVIKGAVIILAVMLDKLRTRGQAG